MCDALVAAYGAENLSSLGAYPGIVHRLDRGTSGAMTGEEDMSYEEEDTCRAQARPRHIWSHDRQRV